MKQSPHQIWLLPVISLIFLNCFTGNSISPEDHKEMIPSGNERKRVFSYVYKNQSILDLKIPMCVKVNKKWQTEVQSMKYLVYLSNNTIILTVLSVQTDSSWFNVDNGRILEKENVSFNFSFSRITGGEGIIGMWVRDSSWYQSEKALNFPGQNKANQILDSIKENNFDWIEITESSYIEYTKNNNKRFVSDFFSACSLKYSLALSVLKDSVNYNQMLLVNTITSDTVNIKEDSCGNILFFHSKYGSYNHLLNSLHCPNDSFPDWMESFLSNNNAN